MSGIPDLLAGKVDGSGEVFPGQLVHNSEVSLFRRAKAGSADADPDLELITVKSTVSAARSFLLWGKYST